jgi:hypothetical protein
VDHNVFAPAKVVMNEIKSRRTFVTGKVNPVALAESFNLEVLEPVRQDFKNQGPGEASGALGLARPSASTIKDPG